MKKKSKDIIYISYAIRGKYGNKATTKFMTANNERAVRFGNRLQKMFPQVHWYVPGRLDKCLTSQGINPIDIVEPLLNLDFAIIKIGVGMLIYSPDNYISNGMNRENTAAANANKSTLVVSSHLLEHPQMLKFTITNWLDTLRKNGKNNSK